MNKKKQWVIWGAVFLISTITSHTAYAGSINGNEESVLSAVNGQFEKDGVIYAVKPEYINSARNYLAQDDVDLTAEQAQAAIAEIYANVQTGVESGYLVEIGRTASEVPAPQEEPTKPQQDDDAASAYLQEDQLGESVQAPEETEEPGESTSTDDNKDNLKPEPVPAVISILELVDKAPQQTYEYMYRDTDDLMNRLRINYNFVEIFTLVSVLAISLVTIIAAYKKLLTIHRHRSLRRILKYILSISIAALSLVLCIFTGLWFGAFQENAILSKLADTGYYTTIYDELRRDTSISFALLDIPESVMDHSLTYEKVVIAARQQVENDLKKGTYKADTSLLVEPLKTDIEEYIKGQSVTMTQEAEAGLDLLMKRLDGKFTALLKWPFGSWWEHLRSDFMKKAVVVLPITIFFIAAANTVLIFLHHYKHRGFALGAKALIGGSSISFLIFTAGSLMISKQWREITPSYMEKFFHIYRTGIWTSGAIVCGIGVLAGCVMLATAKAWKEGR